MTQPKRGRPARAAITPALGALKVKVADAIHDGKGGFLPVGAAFDAADADGLKAKGLAE